MANNQTQLLPAYLVTGSDALKREAVIRRLRTRISQLGDLEFNFDLFSGEAALGADIVAACNTLPFASDVRLVQVDSVEKLKKADSEALVGYLGAPCESTVLCLISDGLAKNTRLYKAIAKLGAQAVIDCSVPKRRDLPALIRSMALTHGASITNSAANALLDLVGEDTVALDAELKKLALAHRGTDPINDSEVTAMVSPMAEVKPWEFVDAFSSRNIQKCMMLQTRMKSVSPLALLAMCVNRIRELMTAQCLMERGQSGNLASVLKMPDWRVKNHRTWARGFSSDELRAALFSARDAEQAMKSGADPQTTFDAWYMAVVSR